MPTICDQCGDEWVSIHRFKHPVTMKWMERAYCLHDGHTIAEQQANLPIIIGNKQK